MAQTLRRVRGICRLSFGVSIVRALLEPIAPSVGKVFSEPSKGMCMAIVLAPLVSIIANIMSSPKLKRKPPLLRALLLIKSYRQQQQRCGLL